MFFKYINFHALVIIVAGLLMGTFTFAQEDVASKRTIDWSPQVDLKSQILMSNISVAKAQEKKKLLLTQKADLAQKTAKNIIKGINFKQDSQSMHVMIATTKKPSNFTVHKSAKNNKIIVEMMNTVPHKALNKQKDIKNFAKVSIKGKKKKTVLHLHYKKLILPDYDVVSTKKGLHIKFMHHKAVDSNKNVAKKYRDVKKSVQISKKHQKASDGNISLNLQNANIVDVLKFISEYSGVNIITSDIDAVVTVKLNNVPWRDALAVLLQVNDLSMREEGGIIKIMPLEKLAKSESMQNRVNNSAAIQSHVIPINHSDVSSVLPQVKEMLSKRGSASGNKRTNALLVNDIQSKILQIKKLVKTLDVQTPQVLIEAKMIEAKTLFARSLGVNWSGNFSDKNWLPQFSTVNGNYAVNMPSADNSSVNINFGLVGGENMALLNAKIMAAQTTRQVKILSEPKIMTVDNKAASINQGYKIPITIPTSSNNTTSWQTEFVDASLKLNVTPHVAADGSILLSVNITNNSPDFSQKNNLGIPAIKVKEAHTQLRVKNGQTAVIGGIYTKLEVDDSVGTPILSKIPLIGSLFKTQGKKDSQAEMLLFLTPKVIGDLAP